MLDPSVSLPAGNAALVRFASYPRVRRTREGPPRDTAIRALAQRAVRAGREMTRHFFRLTSAFCERRRADRCRTFQSFGALRNLPCAATPMIRPPSTRSDRFAQIFCKQLILQSASGEGCGIEMDSIPPIRRDFASAAPNAPCGASATGVARSLLAPASPSWSAPLRVASTSCDCADCSGRGARSGGRSAIAPRPR
jgi:hypothetical protein